MAIFKRRTLTTAALPSGTKGANPVALKKVLGALDTAGGVVAILNPEGIDLLITRVVVDVTTKSTGAGTADFGIAANGTTSNDTLLDGLDVGAATGTFDNVTDKGTNGKTVKKWPAGQYLTGSKASGAMAGLVGTIQVDYRAAAI